MDFNRLAVGLTTPRRNPMGQIVQNRRYHLNTDTERRLVSPSPAMSWSTSPTKQRPTLLDNSPMDSDLAISNPPSPTPTILRRNTTPISQRRRNSHGLFDFKTSPQKPSHPEEVKREHRRTQSFKLPILVSFASATHRTSHLGTPFEEKPASRQLALRERAEQQLEYLHRNSFIGTASLDDFLNILDIDANDRTTTEAHVIEAFSMLARKEQIYMRQRMQSCQGWDLIRPVDPRAPNADCLSQARVKLGSVSLSEFMDFMRSEETKERVPVATIVRAFEMASRIDIERDKMLGTSSKAKALRRWMVEDRADELQDVAVYES